MCIQLNHIFTISTSNLWLSPLFLLPTYNLAIKSNIYQPISIISTTLLLLMFLVNYDSRIKNSYLIQQ